MKLKCVMIFAFLIISQALFAESARAVLEEAYLMGNAPYLIMEISMEIHAGNGIKKRGLSVSMKRENGNTRMLTQIVKPSFLKNMKFLSHKNANGTQSQWLKTQGKTRRLSSANKTERLFDSDFTVEDLSDINLEDFTLKLKAPEKIDLKPCSVVEAIPKSDSDYHSKVFFIDSESKLLRRVRFYNKDRNLIREYSLIRTQKIQNQVYPLSCKMEDYPGKSHTLLIFDTIKVVNSISDRIFNKGNL